MFKNVLLSVLLLVCVASVASANETTAAQDQESAQEFVTEEAGSAAQLDDLNADDAWVFLGCASSRRSCRHEAQHHGYHHYRAVRDHHTCHDHHHPYACYGRD